MNASIPARPPHPATTGIGYGSLPVLIGGAAVAVGTFLPWISAASIFGSLDVTGFDGADGKLVAALGAVICLLIATTASERQIGVYVGSMVLGIAATGVCVVDYIDVSERVDSVSGDGVRASVGFGLYVSIAGAVVAAIGSLIAVNDIRRHDAESQDTTPGHETSPI